jgi:hypothetical protein
MAGMHPPPLHTNRSVVCQQIVIVPIAIIGELSYTEEYKTYKIVFIYNETIHRVATVEFRFGI